MKRLNKTHIFHIFFGLLMFLPFISILSRVIYVQSNKNAKDSYSGNYEITYKYESNQVNSVGDLVEGNIYELSLYDNSVDDWLRQDEKIVFELLTELKVDSNSIYVEETLSPSSFGKNLIIELTYLDESYINVYFNYDDYNDGDYISFGYNATFLNNCIVKYIDNTSLRYELFHYTDYNEIESVNLTGTLDNVFDYSISKFIEDNNFRINFFSWFEDLFLVQSGGVNALYLSFANWYMCYALLVSTGYLLFLILMWFINYVRKILEGGNSFGHGGF